MKKYKNYAQFVQGVTQVCDPSLTQGECLFLSVLAAHSVKGDPHPGNERLRIGCRVTTVRAVQKISEKLVRKGLIEVVQRGDGRGNATVFRIRIEDERFPSPKPRTPEFTVSVDKQRTSEFTVSTDKPRTGEQETMNSDTRNHELETNKPRTLEFTTNLKERIKRSNANTSLGEPSILLPEWIPTPSWIAYLKFRKWKKLPVEEYAQELLLKKLAKLHNDGHDVKRAIEDAILHGWKEFYPPIENRTDRNLRNLRAAGLSLDERNLQRLGIIKKTEK